MLCARSPGACTTASWLPVVPTATQSTRSPTTGTECGETKLHRARGLCRRCYRAIPYIIECGHCGEKKPHAARGLCSKCYGRQNRYPGWAEREAARAENRQQKAEARAVREATLPALKCETCGRRLRLVRDRFTVRGRFCDDFCVNHHPPRRARRGSTWMQPRVKAKLEARQAEARQVEGVR